MTILEQLADHARERTENAKKTYPLEKLREQALSLPQLNFAFEKAIRKRTFFYLRVQKSISFPGNHSA